MITSSEAIVLKRFPYSETSIIARCFTREMGKLGFIVHGARRKKSPTASYFQPMNYLDLVFYYKQNRDLQTISKSAFMTPWLNISEDLKKIAYGMAMVELTDRCLTEQDTHADLFDELIKALKWVETEQNHLNLIFWFYEYRLLTLLGFRPNFSLGEVDHYPLPDPYAGPNTKMIFTMFSRGESGADKNLTVTAADRKVISDYLNTHLQVHFDSIQHLKSLKILKDLFI